MKKKWAIVKIHGELRDSLQVLSQKEYEMYLCETTIIYESDDIRETYKEYYKLLKK